MYASGYNKMFWAMIFIIFNFNLGTINLLPDFIGYLLIYFALKELIPQYELYEKGRVPAIVLTLLTITDIVNFNYNNNSIFLSMRSSIIIALNLYLIYIICKSIESLAEERRLEELKAKVEKRWKVYLITSIILIFYNPFIITMSGIYLFAAAGFIVILITIVISISIALLFKQCATVLKD